MKILPTFLSLFWAILLLFAPPLCGQSFKKAYRYYKKENWPKAQKAFEKHEKSPKNGLPARFYLEKMKAKQQRTLGERLASDAALFAADSLRHTAAAKRKKKWLRYQFLDSSITDLRRDEQLKAIAYVRVRGTFEALDSLWYGLKHPLPELQEGLEKTRESIVNAHVGIKDYDIMTRIIQEHLAYIRPEFYPITRKYAEWLWPAFLDKYTFCDLGRFAKAHPRSFAARDCWKDDAKRLLCAPSLAELIDFHRNNQWTSFETSVTNAINDLTKDSSLLKGLDDAQRQHLARLQQRSSIRNSLYGSQIVRDSAALLQQINTYISDFAPRYSAFRLMDEALQVLLEKKMFNTAAQMLKAALPFFPDSLPPYCKSNFAYQVRTKPYIKGRLPIIEQAAPVGRMEPLTALNTALGDESHPVMSADGRTLFFAAKGRPDAQPAVQAIYRAERDSAGWSKPVLLRELSSEAEQFPLSLTADGKLMLLIINGKLHSSQFLNRQWTRPKPLRLEGLPYIGKGVLSSDGKTLILEGAYAANGVLSSPDIDLFVSFCDENGQWSRPAGLGSDINTDGDEGNPFLSSDGQTLYYTSTGYPGLGQADVFKSKRVKGWTQWERPSNLGREINDTFGHQGFGHVSPDGKFGVFSKSEKDEEGKGELWWIAF